VRLLASLAGISLCVLLVPAAVSAYKIGDIRPGPRLTYFVEKSAKSRTWEIRMAARAWTLSGAKLRIREVKSPRSAMIIERGGRVGTAVTLTNPGPHGGVSLPILILVTTTRERSSVNVAMIMAHEFGHTLGLAHTKGCALMNPASRCAFTEGDFERWNCRMLRPDDVRGVASLWGGRWAPKLPKGCPRERSGPTAVPASWGKPGKPVKPATGGPLKAPSNLAASYDPSGDGTPVLITFRNTTSSLLSSVHVYWSVGACPQTENDEAIEGAHFVEPAAPGQEVRIDLGPPWFRPAPAERSICVAAWSLGKDGSKSARATTTFVAPLDP
jgi:hypothetical protein